MTPLLNDVSRCTGGDGREEICPQRETCRRYTERTTGGPWVSCTNFYQPMNLLGCMDKIEVVKPDEKEKRK